MKLAARTKWHKIFVVLVLLSWVAMAGCGGDENDSPTDPLQNTESEGLTDEEAPVICEETAVSGSFYAGEETVSLDKAELSLSTQHNDQCIGEIELSITTSSGCSLKLEAVSLPEESWSILSAEIEGCLDTPTASFNPDESRFGLLATPETNVEESCISASGLTIAGRLQFTHAEGAFDVNLDEIIFSGDLASTESDSLNCSAEITACEEVACGRDTYGVNCGTCEDGTKCIDGSCQVWNCPPEGPYGAEIGDTVLNIELQDCDGNTHSLQDLCGAPAGFFNLLAGY